MCRGIFKIEIWVECLFGLIEENSKRNMKKQRNSELGAEYIFSLFLIGVCTWASAEA